MREFNYKTFGSPENIPLVLLHGFMGDATDFDKLAEKLQDQFYCIALDLPGHGKTISAEHSEYSIEKASESIIQLLKSQNIEEANLLGYSMGGRIAYYLLTRYPEYFSKAVIESSSPGLQTEDEKKLRIQKDMLLAKRMKMEPSEMFLDDWYALDLFSTIDKKSEAYQKMIQKKLSNDISQLTLSLTYAGTGVMPSLWDELDNIKADLLLITGSVDKKYTDIAKEISNAHKKISHQIIDDVSHNVHFENINEYSKIVKNFLTQKK